MKDGKEQRDAEFGWGRGSSRLAGGGRDVTSGEGSPASAAPPPALPPPPQVVPPPWVLGWGVSLRGPQTRPLHSRLPPPPPHPGDRVHRVGWKSLHASPSGERRGARCAPIVPRLAPPRPARALLSSRPRSPPLPAPLRGRRGAGRAAGEAPSRDCAFARRALGGPTERPDLAPCAPRRSRSRLLLSPPPRLPPPLDHERRALGPWLCPSRTLS